MKHINHLIISQDDSIHTAVEKLDDNEAHIILIVDKNRKLLGTVTDGDVRRGLLKNIGLSEPVKKIMKRNPITASIKDTKKTVFSLMRNMKIKQIPILDEVGCLCELEVLGNILEGEPKANEVVLMAGGLSTRLRPLTSDIPKPMLEIGGKPILETILASLIQCGFWKFHISVNYLGQKIKDYFGDGSKWGVQINYLQEDTKMGTAGSLSLLPNNIDSSLIVMNSDLLTTVDFNHLLSFHHEHKSLATMGVRNFDYTVPYGICKFENHSIVEIVEKPTYKFFINAGIYVLEPEVLNVIPKNKYLDMPALFSLLMGLKQNTTAFPIREYWLDIGQISDFEKARQEYECVFE